MTVPTISGISSQQTSQSVSNASSKLQAAIASIISNNISASDNVAEVSTASQLQSQTSALKQVSNNLVQGLSLSQVASDGVGQIADALTQLQTLVLQAQSPALNQDNRKQISQQIQQLSNRIDDIASGTSFNGQNLLDGSISGAQAISLSNLLDDSGDNNGDLSLPSLSSNALFGGQGLDVSTPDSASQSANKIADALNQVANAQSAIGAFQQLVNYAAANVDSALANQQAAQSNIQDSDFAAANTNDALATFQQSASIALAAQSNRLSPALLQLVG